MKLHTGRWSTDGATKYADSAFNHPENIGVNWRLDSHGVGRIEVTIRARSKIDQYDRYKNHLGHRIALYGSDCYRPISGYITDVEYAGAGRVTYTAKGPGRVAWRMNWTPPCTHRRQPLTRQSRRC
jgi:hypothetical protein